MATSTVHPQANARQRNLSLKALAVVLPFVLLFWTDMWHHTMFFDEVNAWAISAASPTLSKLFYYVHYEGHPWLWYFILWFPSRLTHDPVAMKWVEAAIGTANILIVGLLSPFTYRQRALILCSYFLMWEYTVMCRMYSVMLLFALLYVVNRVRRRQAFIVNCALLGLAANTDTTGLLLSGALLIEYAYSSYYTVPGDQRVELIRRWIPGLLLYVALVGLSVETLWPSKHISWQSSGQLGAQAFNRHRIDRSVGDLVAASWWPISPRFPHEFWGTNITHSKWLYLLVPVVLFVYWKTFRRNRNLLLLIACILLFGFFLADVVYEGHVRNWGISFIAFVIALWLQQQDQLTQGANETGWSPWTYGLLGLSAVAGAFALVGSWLHPFSQAREAARWIEQTQPRNVVLTGAPDVSLASLAEELQRPVLFLECNCVDTFKLFSRYREDFDEPLIPARLARAMELTGHHEVLFSIYRPLKPNEIEAFEKLGLSINPVASFGSADMDNDRYFLYRVRKLDGAIGMAAR